MTALLLVLLCRLGLAQPYVISTTAGGAPVPTPIVAINASIPHPGGITADNLGNVYFTSANTVFKIDTTGMLTRVAGNSRAGYSGDGGPAINAQISGSYGLAIDGAGNLYIADGGNNRIRMVSAGGIITTVAGIGTAGSSGDGGPATLAQLSLPTGVALDSAGNLYIADAYNERVRKISGGIINSFAGDGTCCYSGDGGAATRAQLHQPESVAVDSAGNVYIGDLGNNRVRKVTPSGTISTFAGTGVAGYTGEGIPAVNAQLFTVWGVAVDSAGNVYISDSNRIRKVSAGVITTIAGGQTAGYAGDGDVATKALLNGPFGIVVDPAGNLDIADTGNERVRRIAPNGIITTIAGNGTRNFSGDNGPALKAQLYNPEGLFVTPSGDIYFADYARVRKISASGVITTVAGDGTSGLPADGSPATSTHLSAPEGVAVDAAGNIYVADAGSSNRIRKVTPDGTISTVAGIGQVLNDPEALAFDTAGNLYIADSGNAMIHRLTPGGQLSTVAGNGTQGFSGDGGAATSAQLTFPRGIALDASGNLYIADFGNGRVRKVANGIISTVAGGGNSNVANADGGNATNASLTPQGVAVDANGNLFIADFNNLVWKVAPSGVITRIAGTGVMGYTGDGGSAVAAQLSDVRDVALDASGNLFLSDTSNFAIRRLRAVASLLSIVTASPLPPAGVGGTYAQQLQANGGSPPYTWSLASGVLPAGLILTQGGAILGTPTAPGTANFTVQVTDSVSSIATQAFSITVSAPVISTLSPLVSGFVGLNYSQALAGSGGTPPYSWSLVSGTLPPGLSLSSTGVISGTPTAAGSFNFTVQLTDAASLTATQSYFITVGATPAVSRTGVLAHIAAGGPWTTTMYLANTSATQIVAMLVFHGDDGSALNLPVTVTQQGASQQLTATALNVVINPNATLVVDTGAQLATTVTGWVDVLSSGPLSGFAVFRTTSNGLTSEGTSPLQTQFQSRFDLPYDNRAGFITAVAIANVSNSQATITATIWDSAGKQIDVRTLNLAANGHTAFLFPDSLPATAGLQGIVQFQSSAGNLAGVGLRANSDGTFTSVPVVLP